MHQTLLHAVGPHRGFCSSVGQLLIDCLTAPNPLFFALPCDSGAGPCKIIFIAGWII